MMTTWEGHGVRVEIDERIAHLILARPDQGNALDLPTSSSILEAIRRIEDDATVRAIVLRAEGPRFCVGGDLRAFREAPEGANLCDEVARPLHESINIMIASRRPVVCLVQGAVGGGANGLVLAADIVIAARSTSFRLGYTGSGLSPDCGVTWELPHRVGIARSLDLALTNRRFSAEEALAMGVVSRVVDDGELSQECQRVLDQLSLVPVETLAETKRLMRSAIGSNRRAQLDDEATTIGRIGDTADAREAIAAFLNKRPATLSS